MASSSADGPKRASPSFRRNIRVWGQERTSGDFPTIGHRYRANERLPAATGVRAPVAMHQSRSCGGRENLDVIAPEIQVPAPFKVPASAFGRKNCSCSARSMTLSRSHIDAGMPSQPVLAPSSSRRSWARTPSSLASARQIRTSASRRSKRISSEDHRRTGPTTVGASVHRKQGVGRDHPGLGDASRRLRCRVGPGKYAGIHIRRHANDARPTHDRIAWGCACSAVGNLRQVMQCIPQPRGHRLHILQGVESEFLLRIAVIKNAWIHVVLGPRGDIPW